MNIHEVLTFVSHKIEKQELKAELRKPKGQTNL